MGRGEAGIEFVFQENEFRQMCMENTFRAVECCASMAELPLVCCAKFFLNPAIKLSHGLGRAVL
ncbi:hypothetical protein D3C72_2490920 [compost metagenome]